MWNKITIELGKFAAAVIGLSIAAFVFLLLTSPKVDILHYGQAFHFYNSAVNRLFISVTGRARISSGGKETSYVLLANHPRENTFDHRVSAYSDMIESSGGASTISFIMGSDGSSIIERRYESPQSENLQHQCVRNPYGTPPHFAPASKSRYFLTELRSFDAILSSAARGRKIFATVTYKLNNVDVVLDFPALVVNINPKEGNSGIAGSTPKAAELWQVVSDRIPIYVGGDSLCSGLREGHAALRQFDGPFEVVYLCRNENGVNDFSCSRKINGKVRLFASYI
ncbi:hypothetical protein [Sphingorhabdus sp.]|jgi:hypothetical protein|uniref:hypothetical protein n=1 Tax=Sphingorhabdus sp. TaxID=1902408 RepID=UPI002C460D5C|nr:hypothetical protein [Sphingorhabdus sp.]HMT42310.1 hypothetical protein [Sphingorhabdus sp.]